MRPNAELNPDECVAMGAALAGVYRHRQEHPAFAGADKALEIPEPDRDEQASLDTQDLDPERPSLVDARMGVSSPAPSAPKAPAGLPGLTITDIATHPLGIIVLDANLRERIVELIPEASALPTEKRGRFAYAYDNMTAVRVQITEGHGSSRDEVMVIGDVILDRLPPRPRGTPIDVIYRYNTDQILEVDIIDVETNASRSATISIKGSLSQERIADARASIERARIR
jgi:molecular chaperone DnaK (HSP70)